MSDIPRMEDLPADVQRQIRSAIQGLANSDLGQVVGAHTYASRAEDNNAEAPLPVPERFEDIPMSQPIPEAVAACLQWANVGGAVPEAYYTDMHPRLVTHGRTILLRNEGAAPEHRWWTADMVLRWWRQNEAHMPFGDNTGVACACIYAIPDEATYQMFKTRGTEAQRMEFCTHVMVVDTKTRNAQICPDARRAHHKPVYAGAVRWVTVSSAGEILGLREAFEHQQQQQQKHC